MPLKCVLSNVWTETDKAEIAWYCLLLFPNLAQTIKLIFLTKKKTHPSPHKKKKPNQKCCEIQQANKKNPNKKILESFSWYIYRCWNWDLRIKILDDMKQKKPEITFCQIYQLCKN